MPCLTLILMTLVSCSDDDVKTPLATVRGEVSDIAYTSLSFKWSKVDGAIQYDYELTDSDGTLCGSGVTQENHIEIDGLKPATDYTLRVLAYAAMNSQHTTSEPMVLKATTLAATTLATPEIEVTIDGRYANITWDAIQHSEGYSYELSRDNEIEAEGTTDETTLELSALDPGSYVLTVKTVSPGDAYTESESTVAFSIESEEIWRVNGVYSSSLIDGSWPVTMIAYSDDSYELVDWYQTDGISLCFFIDKYDTSTPYKMSASQYDYDSSTSAYAVPIGRSGLPIIYVFPGNSRFDMTGDKDGGTLVVAVKNRNTSVGSAKRDTFVWGTNLQ